MTGGDFPGDRESQAAAVGGMAPTAVKAVEYPFAIFGRNARPGILDFKVDAARSSVPIIRSSSIDKSFIVGSNLAKHRSF